MLNPNFNYDKLHDILYIHIGTQTPSYTKEEIEGIILRYDMISDKLTGITILDFFKRLSKNDSSLHNLPIDFCFSEFSIENYN